MKKNNIAIVFASTVSLLLCIYSCKKFVEIDPPRTSLTKPTVFQSDATATAAILDIYYQLSSSAFAGGSSFSISFLGTLLSDEQINYTGDTKSQQFNDNTLQQDNSYILRLWADLYKCIYKSNAILEGITLSVNMSEPTKKQLKGEALFIRTFCHFYLVNLWGDAPLILNTDYKTNQSVSRTPVSEVYQQIVADLKDAQNLLTDAYSISNGERVRANKSAATALLARVYLYMEDWANAEAQATGLIANTGQYNLVANLNDVFLKNSTEAILQFWNAPASYPNDFFTFYIFFDAYYGALHPGFVNDFESGDQRGIEWIGSINNYYFPKKYQSFDPGVEYSTVLRLAEQYLIRAEARVQQDNIIGAQEDINAIRHRAGLGDTPNNDKASLLFAIEEERKHELFTEWGHRWFDLKHTGRADAVLSPIKSEWTSTAVLFPIPESELINNSSLTQNQGY